MSVPDWFLHKWHHCSVSLTLGSGRHRPQPGTTTPRGRRDDWMYYGVLSGAIEIQQLETRLRLKAGEATLVPPGYSFVEKETTNTSRKTTACLIHFVNHSAGPTPNPLFSLGLPRKVRCRNRERFRKNCAAFFDCFGNFGSPANENWLRGRALLHGLLADFVIDGFAQGVFLQEEQAYAPDWLKDLREHLRSQIVNSSFRHGDLVKASGHTGPYTNAVFKRHFGIPPMRWLKEQRIQLAARMLRTDSSLSIAEVSRRCGYSDAALFSRHFRSQMKASPSSWRSGEAGAEA